jgi:hypothetical protein
MPAIRVRVGASLDANVQTVFRPLVEAAKRARQQVANEMRGLSSESAGAAAKMGGAYRTNFTEVEKAAIRASRAEAKAAQDGANAQAKAAAYVARIKDRYYLEEQKRSEQAERANTRAAEKVARSQERYAEKQASRTGYWSIRYMDRAMRGAGRLGLDIARGAGVDLSLGGIIGKNVGLQQSAVDVANSGFNTGVKGSEKRVEGSEILRDARAVADATAMDAGDALDGLRAFVGKTGDLKTGRDILADMAKLAKATGGSMGDYVDAAGDIANNLGDVEDKSTKVSMIMRTFAGQGKAGAVEIRDLASLMARVQAASSQYGGDSAKNFALIGAMVQEARAKGGAASAREGTQSVMTFTNMFSKPKNRRRLDAAGIKYENANGSLKSPDEIIMQMIQKASDKNGNLNTGEMGKLVGDANARKATRGFENIYREAGGGDKGMAAVKAEFQRLRDVAMGQGEIEDSFKRSMATSASQVQLFNNALSKIGDDVVANILPQMKTLGPAIVKVVDGLSKFVGWAAENPGKAIAVALTASIARANIETVVRSGIEALMRGTQGGSSGYNPAAGFGGGIGFAGNLGAGLAILSAAITVEKVGELIIDDLAKKVQNGQDDSDNMDAELHNAIADYNTAHGQGKNLGPGIGAEDGGGDPILKHTSESMLQKQYDKLGVRVAGAERPEDFVSSLLDPSTTVEAEATKRADAEKLSELKASMDKVAEMLATKLVVHVDNMPKGGLQPLNDSPTVDPTGRIGFEFGKVSGDTPL